MRNKRKTPQDGLVSAPLILAVSASRMGKWITGLDPAEEITDRLSFEVPLYWISIEHGCLLSGFLCSHCDRISQQETTKGRKGLFWLIVGIIRCMIHHRVEGMATETWGHLGSQGIDLLGFYLHTGSSQREWEMGQAMRCLQLRYFSHKTLFSIGSITPSNSTTN